MVDISRTQILRTLKIGLTHRSNSPGFFLGNQNPVDMTTQTSIHPSSKGLVILSFLCVHLALPAIAQTPAEDFRRAVVMERAEGDYAGAIALYERVVETSDDRDLTGRALMQLARAYENLGRADAARTYRRVLSEFADMDALVAEARAGYARTREPVASPSSIATDLEPGARTMLNLEGAFEEFGAVMSPSGRLLAYSPEYKSIEIAEVSTSKRRRIDVKSQVGAPSDTFGEDPWIDYLAFSPDESRIATSVNSGSADGNWISTIVLVDVLTGESRKLRTIASLFPEGSGFTCGQGFISDWSADGTSLLVHLSWKGGQCERSRRFESQLAVVPISGGPARFLPNVDGQRLLLGGSNLANRSACLSADGRYALAQVQLVTEDGERGPVFIRRYEVATGQSAVWRRGTGEVGLFGCTWKPGTILYAERALGGTTLREASASSLDSANDELVVILPEDGWAVAFSKEGDFALEVSAGSSGNKAFLTDLDARGFPVGSSTSIMEAGAITMSMSPSGVLAWTGPRHILKRFDTATKTELPDVKLPETEFGGIRWQDENRLVMRSQSEFEPQTSGGPIGYVEGQAAIWNTFLLDAEGQVQSQLSALQARELGIQWAVPMRDNRWLGWLPHENCYGTVDTVSRETRKLACPTKPDQGQARALLSPSDDHAITLIWDVGLANLVVGVLDLHDGDYRVLDLPREGQVSLQNQWQWISPTQILLGFTQPGNRWVRALTDAVILDIESGEVVRDLSQTLSALEVRNLFLAPKGQAVVYGRPKGSTTQDMVAVVHDILGVKDD